MLKLQENGIICKDLGRCTLHELVLEQMETSGLGKLGDQLGSCHSYINMQKYIIHI